MNKFHMVIICLGKKKNKDFLKYFRHLLVREVCRQVCYKLGVVDDAESQSGIKGTSLITFNAIDGGVDRGFLHYNNFEYEWGNITFRGATHILQGWKKMLDRYEASFMDKSESNRPLLLALIITDGELQGFFY